MLPKTKNTSSKGLAPSTHKKRGKASKKQPPPPHSDMETTTDAGEEPTVRSMMSVLTALSNRMDHYERSREGRQDSASVPPVYAMAPEPTTSRTTIEEGPARCPGAADGYLDVSDEVQVHVARHL